MLKLCRLSVIKLLSLLFGNCFRDGDFRNDWVKPSVIPKHKQGNNQSVSNYRPVSLLPIVSKKIKKLIFDSIYEILDRNCLLNVNHSGFKPGDSCVHQSIAVAHNMFTAFEANLAVFCRIYSKPLIEFCIL